ncbi:hypothetical protein PoB_000762800 [Plakobranchus ocellatus]|uniref:Uncharacterized protein n=1 Tax=Plakobranchus ocellatus TaxID=259542 RepID=A0AAV3YF75_9GAST|nr:hypothetical protein PoB_000762800 [Plakobranchus ocellatus]
MESESSRIVRLSFTCALRNTTMFVVLATKPNRTMAGQVGIKILYVQEASRANSQTGEAESVVFEATILIRLVFIAPKSEYREYEDSGCEVHLKLTT